MEILMHFFFFAHLVPVYANACVSALQFEPSDRFHREYRRLIDVYVAPLHANMYVSDPRCSLHTDQALPQAVVKHGVSSLRFCDLFIVLPRGYDVNDVNVVPRPKFY